MLLTLADADAVACNINALPYNLKRRCGDICFPSAAHRRSDQGQRANVCIVLARDRVVSSGLVRRVLEADRRVLERAEAGMEKGGTHALLSTTGGNEKSFGFTLLFDMPELEWYLGNKAFYRPSGGEAVSERRDECVNRRKLQRQVREA